MLKKGWGWVMKHEWLVLVLGGVMLLRIPTLLEPYWYGDEGIYLVIGKALNMGKRLYLDIHDNKPPLLYLMAALAGGNQFWFRAIAAVWNVITVGVFAGLANKIWGHEKKWPVIGSTVIFALLSNIPLLEGNIANAELFFLLPTLLATRLLVAEKMTLRTVGWAGLIVGMGGLFKIPALIEAGVWPVIWWRFGDKDWFKKSAVFGLAAALPLAASIGYYWAQGVGRQYLIAAGLQNVPYLASWSGPASTGIFTLTGRAVAAVMAGGIIILLGKKIGRRAMWVGLWGIAVWFAALLSGRPYPHYWLQGAGLGAVICTLMVWGKKWEKTVAGMVLGGAIVSAITFRFYHYRSWEYYANFGKWVTGRQSTAGYYDWFSPQVNRNYKIAEIVAAGSTAGDGLFIWGDEPMIYALTKKLPPGRYTVKYHVLDFRAQEETITAVKQARPKYIVSWGKEEELPGLGELLESGYMIERQVEDAKVYRRVTGGEDI